MNTIKNPVNNVLKMIAMYDKLDDAGKSKVLNSVEQVVNAMYNHYLQSIKYKEKINQVIK